MKEAYRKVGSIQETVTQRLSSVEARRKALEIVLSPFLRREVVDLYDGIASFEELVARGYGGVIFYNHFSKKDPFQVMRELPFRRKSLRDKEVVSPIGKHQVLPGLRAVGEFFGVYLMPIVTESTRERDKKKKRPKGYVKNQGVREFIEISMQTLENGGILTVAPQATREGPLRSPKSTVGTLLAHLDRRHIDTVVFLCVGLGLVRKGEYLDYKSGYNPLQRYKVTVGRIYTRAELVAAIKDAYPQERDYRRAADAFVYDTLRKLVPPALQGNT